MKIAIKIFGILLILLLGLFVVKNLSYRDFAIEPADQTEYVLRKSKIFDSYYRIALCGRNLGYTRSNCFILVKGIGLVQDMRYENNNLTVLLHSKPNITIDREYELIEKRADKLVYSNHKNTITFQY